MIYGTSASLLFTFVLSRGGVVLLQNKEGEQIHPLCALDAIYKEDIVTGKCTNG